MLREAEKRNVERLIRKYGFTLAAARAREVHRLVLEFIEKPLIESILERTDGNQSKTAKILGINRNTLHAKIKKLGIRVENFKYSY